MKTIPKVLIGFLVITVGTVIAMSGSSGADPYLDVHTVAADPPKHADKTVSVKGAVEAGSIQNEQQAVRFRVLDASGDPAHAEAGITVHYQGALPDAFGPKMVVVTGTLVETANGWVLSATDIQVGCSSKY